MAGRFESQVIHRFIHRLRSPRGRGPLTGRAILVLLGLVYLFLGPIPASVDIVSASLAYGLLAVMLLALIAVTLQGILLNRSCLISVSAPEKPATSGEKVRIVVHTTEIRVLPLLSLTVTLEFERPGPAPSIIVIEGRGKSARHLFVDVTFPHRGMWRASHVECTVSDITGLFRYRWHNPLDVSILVTPPIANDSHLPILSSSQRPGDLVVDTLNRQGDPFDIKPYHPTDGVKRIIWKAFAKRGELLSRHPEASMTPEGYVVIYTLARPSDDELCSRALAYIRMLCDLNLDIVMGCEGQGSRSAAVSAEAAESLLVESVWDAATLPDLKGDAARLLQYCATRAGSTRLEKIIIFCAANRFLDGKEEERIRTLATWLAEQSLSPVFCFLPYANAGVPLKRSLTSMAKSWFLLPSEAKPPLLPTPGYQSFVTMCMQRRWEVHL